jgi:hypothetical protein
VHGTGTVVPAWLTTTVWSPIFSEPLRAAPLFAATPNVTVPLPVPIVAPVSEIHDALLMADQLHDDAALTDTEPLVPDAGEETSFGETEMLQTEGGGGGTFACCVTFTVWFATAIDAVRAVVPGFGAIVKFTVPGPVPFVPLVSTTHAASA